MRVNALCPGVVHNNQPEAFISKLEDLIPLGRLASIDEYRSAIQFLCSDASSYMNGHNLVMDGHHRLQASIKLGLIKVPCFIYSYKDIIPYSLRENVEVTSTKIIENFLLSKIYPNKTAKHDLPIYKFKPIELYALK